LLLLASCYSADHAPAPECEPLPVPEGCTLLDDFDDGDPESNTWSAWMYGATGVREEACTLMVEFGAGMVPPASIAGTISRDVRDLREMRWSAEVRQTTSPTTMAETYLIAGPDTRNRVAIRQTVGILQARMRVNDLPVTLAEVSYDPIAHRFWAIRHVGDDVGFETSVDGTHWSLWISVPKAFELSAAYVDLEAETNTTVTDPGAAHFGRARVCPIE